MPTAVKLLPGDCLDREMIGLDTASYNAAVAYIVAAPKLLAEGRAKEASLQQELAIEKTSTAQLRGEVLRARQEGDATNARFNKLSEQNKVLSALPLQKPLLLDPRTYEVGAGGLLLGLLLGFIAHH